MATQIKFMNERLQQELDKLWESGELSNDANSTSKCKITKCFCKSTPLVLRNSIFFLVSH